MDLVTTSNFHATLLPGSLSVILIPPEHIRACSWPLLNLLLYGGCSCSEDGCEENRTHICRSVESELFSIVVDHDGATIFMDPNGANTFHFAGMQDKISIAPQKWRAIQIHLGPIVAEFPGIVSFLSKLLAEDAISILNMSTYDTDIIYVQECDLDKAVDCLQKKLSRGVHGLKEDKDAAVSIRTSDEVVADSEQIAESENAITRIGSEQYLTVYPGLMALVRLKKEMIRESAYGLTQLVLLSKCSSDQYPTCLFSNNFEKLFWCYCETNEEISLIVDEASLSDFSDNAIIVSPDRWRVIKLCGKIYGFDETGIVAAMSNFETETQVLNVSSYGSNITLVLEETLEESLQTLCSSLNISRIERL